MEIRLGNNVVTPPKSNTVFDWMKTRDMSRKKTVHFPPIVIYRPRVTKLTIAMGKH
jgi:hypothetical protein